jgi:HSP20 family protein
MALNRWEPVPVHRLFNSLFDTPTLPTATTRRWLPATDIVESDTHLLLRADLPGVAEEDIHVELNGDILTISGQRKSEHEARGNGFLRVERSSGSFRRSVRLPEGVDAEGISATFERGVLEVSVPKPEQVKPRKVQITLGTGSSATDSSETTTIESGETAAEEPQAA